MKLFSLRLTTLKSKLYAIVFASFIVRVVAFFMLPSSPSNLAPDEGNYGALTEWIANGKSADEYSYGNLYIISRTLILPASWLTHLGLSGLDSVRIVSSIYGLLTISLVASFFLTFYFTPQNGSFSIPVSEKKFLFLLTIFAFLPSNLIWSMHGLRESALQFWVVAVFIMVNYVFEVKKNISRLSLFAIPLGILFVYSSRPQVGLILGVSLLIYFVTKMRDRVAQILIALTLIGIVLGVSFTTFSNEPPEGLSVRANLVKEALKSDFSLVDSADRTFQSHLGNRVGAASEIKTISCPNSGASRLDSYFCLAYRAPYTTFVFLFRPLPGVEVTSVSSLFAALENVLWLAAFIYVIAVFIRRRNIEKFKALFPSIIFLTTYSISAGAYEGNMGTAFRHKSLILWVVILLIGSALVKTQDKPIKRKTK
jgi:hypothetical protein